MYGVSILLHRVRLSCSVTNIGSIYCGDLGDVEWFILDSVSWDTTVNHGSC